MKHILLLVTCCISIIFHTLSQNSDSIHTGKVIGSFSYGVDEITAIIDETSGCLRKSVPHSVGVFIPQESVELVFIQNSQLVEVHKLNQVATAYAPINCITQNNGCDSGLCIITNTNNKLIVEYSFENEKLYFSAYVNQNNSITSSITIYKHNGLNQKVFESNFVEKRNEEYYKIHSKDAILSASQNILIQDSTALMLSEESLFEKFIEQLKNSQAPFENIDLIANNYYHLAILKTVNRAISQNSDTCNCSPIPYYFAENSPFICQEDFNFNIQEMLLNLEENKIEFKSKYSDSLFAELKNFLDSNKDSVTLLSFEKMYNGITKTNTLKEFNDFIENFDPSAIWCPFGLGTDLGCCGNYSGCCILWRIVCFFHDVACLKCDKWHCTTYCVPLTQ